MKVRFASANRRLQPLGHLSSLCDAVCAAADGVLATADGTLVWPTA